MAVTAQQIIDRAKETLLDPNATRWTEPELLDYLNAGIKAIVTNKPDAFLVTADVALTPNSSRQSIPTGALQLVDIVRVVDEGGAVRQIDRGTLDKMDPDWHSTSGVPKHFTQDVRNPKEFYVYPVPVTAVQVEMVYAGVPADIIISDPIPVDDIYENALYYWILAYAYAKNTKRGDMSKTGNYLNMFSKSIGVKSQTQFSFAPQQPEQMKGNER